MDRLPKEKIGQIWSLIHTFFSEKHFEKIWVIVPYSRDHIAKGFKKEDLDTDHFIDKTFTIQYQVPPPISSDWKTFFDRIFSEAFGSSEVGELAIVRSIFDRLNDKITPRKIIIFINETVALKKMWKMEVPLRYIAIFSLTKKQILKNPNGLILNKGFLGRCESLFADDNDLQNYISALVYNIPIGSAAQVALQQELKNALRDPITTIEKMDSLARLPFFCDMMERLLLDDPDNQDIELRLNLISDEVYKDLDQDRMLNVWNTLQSNRRHLQVTAQQFTENDKILLLRISPHKRQLFVDKLVSDLDKVDQKNFSGKQYYSLIKDMESFIETHKIKDAKVNVTLSQPMKHVETFLDYLTAAGKDYAKFGLRTSAEALNTYLIDKTPNDLTPYISVVNLADDANYNFSKFLERLSEAMKGDDATLNNLPTILTLLKGLTKERPIKQILPFQKLTDLLDDAEGSSVVFPDLVSMRIKLDDDMNESENQAYTILDSQNDELTKSLINCIEYYENLGNLIAFCANNPKPLVTDVTRALVMDKQYSSHRLSNVLVLRVFESACKNLNIDPIEFLKFLDNWRIDSITKTNIKNVITKPSAYTSIFTSDSRIAIHLTKCVVEFLEDIDVVNWKLYLGEPTSYQFIALMALLDGKKITSLPKNVFDAYLELLVEIAKGSFLIPSEQQSSWLKLYEIIDKRNLTAVLKNIRDIFLQGQIITPEQFRFFAPMFMDRQSMLGREGDFSRSVLPQIIDDPDVLNTIILTNQEYYGSLIKAAGDDAFILTGKITALKKSQPDNVDLAKFTKSLGLDDPKPVEEDEEKNEKTEE